MPSAPIPQARFNFVLFGAGTVGTAVATLLRAAGHLPVGIASPTQSSAQRAARYLEAPVLAERARLPEESDVVLIGAKGAAIADAAEIVAASMVRPLIAWHFAGALGIEPLAPIVERGGAACALHPVQACPDIDAAVRRLPGSAWGVTCSEGLSEWARAVVAHDLQGSPVDLDGSRRALWHAATALTANGITALLAEGEAMLAAMGIDRPGNVLGPLAAGTVANAREGGGGAAALTGPVVRNEVETLRLHLEAIETGAPQLQSAYVLGARLVIGAARRAGRLGEEQARRMTELVEAE